MLQRNVIAAVRYSFFEKILDLIFVSENNRTDRYSYK